MTESEKCTNHVTIKFNLEAETRILPAAGMMEQLKTEKKFLELWVIFNLEPAYFYLILFQLTKWLTCNIMFVFKTFTNFLH